jgi:hypothetical protein
MAMRNIPYSTQAKFVAERHSDKEIKLPTIFTTGLILDVFPLFKHELNSFEQKSKSPEELGSQKDTTRVVIEATKVGYWSCTTQGLLVSLDFAGMQDISSQIHIGGEYNYGGIALRAGYKYNFNESIENGKTDEQGLTAGFGLQTWVNRIRINIDYSYTPFSVLDDVQQLSLRFSF